MMSAPPWQPLSRLFASCTRRSCEVLIATTPITTETTVKKTSSPSRTRSSTRSELRRVVSRPARAGCSLIDGLLLLAGAAVLHLVTKLLGEQPADDGEHHRRHADRLGGAHEER